MQEIGFVCLVSLEAWILKFYDKKTLPGMSLENYIAVIF